MCPPDEQAPKTDGEAASNEERRKFPRAPLQLLIQYRFDTFEEFLAEYSIDISVGGMFIKTQQPHDLGAFVYLQFALKDGSRLIEGLGRVVRVNPTGAEKGMGVEFVNFDPESMALIEEIVAHRLEKHRNA